MSLFPVGEILPPPPAREPEPDRPHGSKPWLDEYARAFCGCPDGWRSVSWDASGETAPEGWVKVEGAIYHPANEGGRGWDNRDMASQRVVFIEIAKMKSWVEALAAEKGICAECWGCGKVWTGWNKDAGHRYRDCPKCTEPNGVASPAGEGRGS